MLAYIGSQKYMLMNYLLYKQFYLVFLEKGSDNGKKGAYLSRPSRTIKIEPFP